MSGGSGGNMSSSSQRSSSTDRDMNSLGYPEAMSMSSTTFEEGKGRHLMLCEICDKLKLLEPALPILNFITVGHIREENDFVFNSLFSLPKTPISGRMLRRDELDRNFKTEWLTLVSPILPDRVVNISWGDSPPADSPASEPIHNATPQLRDLHRINREADKLKLEAFLMRKSPEKKVVDVCLCIVDLLSPKDPTPVFEVPYRFFAKSFVHNCGFAVVNNGELFVNERLECQSPGCKCRAFAEKTMTGPPTQTSSREKKICADCGHKKTIHHLEDNRALKIRKNKRIKSIERRMSAVFHGKTSNAVEKGDSKSLKGVIKNIFDIYPDVGTKHVPVLESKYDEEFPDGTHKWFAQLWFKIFMRLADDALYTFYMATDLQNELDLDSLKKVLRKVEAAVDRKFPASEHERKIR